MPHGNPQPLGHVRQRQRRTFHKEPYAILASSRDQQIRVLQYGREMRHRMDRRKEGALAPREVRQVKRGLAAKGAKAVRKGVRYGGKLGGAGLCGRGNAPCQPKCRI